MSYNKNALIQRVRNILGDRPWETTVAEAVDTSETDIDLGSTATYEDFAEGDILEINDEVWRVYTSTDAATDTITVLRAYDGSTAASHASGDRLIKNPTWSRVQIVEAIDESILSLWPYVWKQASDTVTPDTTSQWYDLNANVMGITQVYQLYGPSDTYVGFYGAKRSYKPLMIRRDLPAAIAASGIGIRFPHGYYHNSNTITIYYRAKLTTTIATSAYSDVDDGVLSELVAYTAASRLVVNRVAPRVTGTDNSMYDQSIEPAAISQAAQVLERKSVMLRNQYHEELMTTAPPMMKWSG